MSEISPKGARTPNGGHMGLAPESTQADQEYADLFNEYHD